MFNQFLKSADSVISEAKQSAHVIQEEYFPIYDVIEQYVKDNNLILSNAEMLIKKEKTTLRSYIIYGDYIFGHANALANLIAAINIYVLLFTTTKNEDFTIVVDGNRIVQLFNIPKRFIHVIKPVKIGASNILLYPPEFELIEIYHQLYLPNYYSDREKLELWERELRLQLSNRRGIIGRGESKTTKFSKPTNLLMDNKIIINWLKNRNDYVLIGTNAINTLLNDSRYCQKIQLIVADNISLFINELSNLIAQHTGHTPTYKSHQTHLPTEPRLTKTVLSINIPASKHSPSRNMHLVDIFNAASYELIPYTVYANINIGYPNVLKMFTLIDLWFLRILSALGFVTKNSLEKGVGINLRLLDKTDEISLSMFGRELYLGVYSDIKRYKQKQGSANVFYPYNPEQCRYQKGTYRVISHGKK